MNPTITQLIRSLKASDVGSRNNAAISVGLMLERAAGRPLAEEVWAMLLPSEILAHTFSAGDLEEIFAEIMPAFEWEGLEFSAKMSLLHSVLKTSGLKHAAVPMRFIATHAATFTEPEAFDVLAQLATFAMRNIGEPDRLQQVLQEHKVWALIHLCKSHPSDRLQQSAARLESYLHRFLQPS